MTLQKIIRRNFTKPIDLYSAMQENGFKGTYNTAYYYYIGLTFPSTNSVTPLAKALDMQPEELLRIAPDFEGAEIAIRKIMKRGKIKSSKAHDIIDKYRASKTWMLHTVRKITSE